jgi:hypothetical protein
MARFNHPDTRTGLDPRVRLLAASLLIGWLAWRA